VFVYRHKTNLTAKTPPVALLTRLELTTLPKRRKLKGERFDVQRKMLVAGFSGSLQRWKSKRTFD
jgi:hypothetical protein